MRVLIIDDQPALLATLTGMLMMIPEIEAVCPALGGLEGLKFAAEMHPDVVLTDFSMPDLNGAKVTRRIKERDWAPYVVMMSFHAEPEYREMAHEVGADAYLVKRDLEQQLVPVLRRLTAGPAGKDGRAQRSSLPGRGPVPADGALRA